MRPVCQACNVAMHQIPAPVMDSSYSFECPLCRHVETITVIARDEQDHRLQHIRKTIESWPEWKQEIYRKLLRAHGLGDDKQ